MGTIKKRNHSQATEKPKGKLRRLRDNGGKRARVAREEARDQTVTGKLFKGPCLPQSCLGGVEEVACVPLNNNTTHYCLCTSNGLPPTSDFKCPRSTVPVTPVPIHNIIPPTTSNTSAESRSASPASDEISKSLVSRDVFPDSTSSDLPAAGVNGAGVLLGTAVIGAVVFILLVISVVIFYVRRRMRRVDGKAQPVGQAIETDNANST